MKKILYIIALAAAAASMTACGSKAETSEPAVTSAAAETTTVTTAAAATEATTTTVTTATTAEEPSAAPDETAASETTEAAPEQTTEAGDLDLDAMMSSIEAEIPDITVFTGFKDIDVTVTYPKHDDEEPDTTTTTASANAETTAATTAAPPTVSAPVTDMFSFNFDGVTYKMPITGSELQLPDGWVDATSSGRSDRIYDKSGFAGCHIEEIHRGGDTLNGVYVHVVNDLQDGKPVPALSMAGGISWGSDKDEIKAAFGEPVRESSFNQYGTTTTALFYSSDEGDTMILYVPENCGLALIELYRY
ncbi:MAG: hypothetical protein K6C13_10265 [Oscillospiraceae bacterium]|nr:hypothetical protein [Oscillospiraceae bacterium]